MTRMQKEMQERISREQLDQAFDARFPEEMRTKLRNARVAVAGLGIQYCSDACQKWNR